MRGKLLVSTKVQSSVRKTILQFGGIFFIGLGIVVLLFELTHFDLLRNMGYEFFSNPTIGIIIGLVLDIAMIGYGVYSIFLSVGFKSYCDVYENAVVGKTTLSMRHPNDPMRDFELAYNVIVNVSEAGQMLYIQTKHESYDVLATKNRSDALKEIRARMTGNQ